MRGSTYRVVFEEERTCDWKWNIRVDRIDRDGTVHEGTWDHGYMSKEEAIEKYRSVIASDFDAQRQALDLALFETTQTRFSNPTRVYERPPTSTTEHLLHSEEYLLALFRELVLDQRTWHSFSRSGLRRLDYEIATKVCRQRRDALRTALRLVRVELARRGVQ